MCAPVYGAHYSSLPHETVVVHATGIRPLRDFHAQRCIAQIFIEAGRPCSALTCSYIPAPATKFYTPRARSCAHSDGVSFLGPEYDYRVPTAARHYHVPAVSTGQCLVPCDGRCVETRGSPACFGELGQPLRVQRHRRRRRVARGTARTPSALPTWDTLEESHCATAKGGPTTEPVSLDIQAQSTDEFAALEKHVNRKQNRSRLQDKIKQKRQERGSKPIIHVFSETKPIGRRGDAHVRAPQSFLETDGAKAYGSVVLLKKAIKGHLKRLDLERENERKLKREYNMEPQASLGKEAGEAMAKAFASAANTTSETVGAASRHVTNGLEICATAGLDLSKSVRDAAHELSNAVTSAATIHAEGLKKAGSATVEGFVGRVTSLTGGFFKALSSLWDIPMVKNIVRVILIMATVRLVVALIVNRDRGSLLALAVVGGITALAVGVPLWDYCSDLWNKYQDRRQKLEKLEAEMESHPWDEKDPIMMRAQNGYFAEIGTVLLSGVMALNTKYHRGLKAIVEAVSHIPRLSDGLEGLSDIAMRLFEDVINYVRVNVLGKDKWELRSRYNDKIKDWSKRVERLVVEDHAGELMIDAANYNVIVNLLNEQNQLSRELPPIKEVHNVRSHINMVGIQLTNLLMKFKHSGMASHSTRMSPVVVCLSGKPGIGKTFLTMPTVLSLLRKVVQTYMPNRMQEFEEHPERFIYPRKASEEFWSGYNNQVVTVFEDWLQSKSSVGNTTAIMDMIDCAGVFANMLHMADLMLKGNVMFTSEIIWVTTNVDEMEKNLDGITDPKAIVRRLDLHYEVRLRPGFAVTSGPLSGTLDMSKVETGGDQIDVRAYEFRNVRTGECLTFEQFQERVWQYYQSRKAAASNYATLNRRIAQGVGTVFKAQGRGLDAILASAKSGDKPAPTIRERATAQLWERGKQVRVQLEQIQLENPQEFTRLVDEQVFEILKENLNESLTRNLERGEKWYKKYAIPLGIVACAGIAGLLAFLFWPTTSTGDAQSTAKNPYVTDKVGAKGVPVTIVTKPAVDAPPGSLNAKPQNDPTAQDTIHALWNRNVFSVAGHGMGGYVLCIGGNVFLYPRHYILAIKKHAEKYPLNGTEEVTISNSGVQYRVKMADFLGAKEIPGYEGDDIVVGSFTPGGGFQKRPNIVEKFVTEAQLRRLKSCYVYYMRLQRNGIMLNHHAQCWPYGSTVINYALQDGTNHRPKRQLVYLVDTEDGECGAPLVIDDPTSRARKICGMHVAGGEGGACAYPLTAELIASALTLYPIDYSGPLALNLKPQVLTLPKPFLFIQEKEEVHAPHETKIIPSPLYSTYFEPLTAPARLCPFWNGEAWISPFEKAFMAYSTEPVTVDLNLVLQVADDEYKNLARWATVRPQEVPRVYTFEEACVGIPGGLPSLNRKSSPGYKYRGSRGPGKTDWFGKDGAFDLSNPRVDALRRDVQYFEDELAEGRLPLHVFNAFLKDERRSLLKVADGATRPIFNPEMDFTIVVRRYFGSFCQLIERGAPYNGYLIGVNVYSPTVNYMAQTMLMADKVFDGDYKKFDTTTITEFSLGFGRAADKHYARGADTIRDQRIRLGILMILVNPSVLLGKYLVEMNHPAGGHALTAHYNSWEDKNSLRYQFARLNPWGVHASFRFDECVAVFVLGDDNQIGNHGEAVEFFEPNKLAAGLKLMGKEYTSAHKGKDLSYLPFSQVTLLKRGYRYEEMLGRYVMPLQLEVVLEMPMWTHRGLGEKEVMDTFEIALAELALHGDELWDEWSPKMLHAFEEWRGYPHRISTRLQALTLTSHMECIL